MTAQLKTFRVSTEDGDTYTIKARNIEEARKEARDQQSCRFTIYEDKPIRWTR